MLSPLLLPKDKQPSGIDNIVGGSSGDDDDGQEEAVMHKTREWPGDYDWRITFGSSTVLRDAQDAATKGTVYRYNLGARMRRLRDVAERMKEREKGWRWWDSPYKRPR